MTDEVPNEAETQNNSRQGDTAVKEMVYRYTIFGRKKNVQEEAKFSSGFFPFVGVVTAAITFLVTLIIFLIADNLADASPFTAVMVLAIPLIIYRFRTTAGLMKLGDRMFPQGNGNIGPAGLMYPILIVLIIYGIYWMVGAPFMLICVPALEIAVTLSIVSMVYFSDVAKDQKFVACRDTPGLITATIISVIGIVAFSGVGLLIVDMLTVTNVILAVFLVVIALLIGYILAKVYDKKLKGLDNDLFWASFDISRVLIGILFIIIAAIVLLM